MTCGVAIDVPLMVFVAVLLVYQSEVMLEPGANRSRQEPKLEKLDRASELVVEPTVRAGPTRDGEPLQAFAPLSLPAATAYVTPALIEFCTAVSRALETPPPRLMFATAGPVLLPVTQSMPAITPESVPLPLQSSTRTGFSVTHFATP